MPTRLFRRLTAAIALALAASVSAPAPATAAGNLIAEIQQRGTLRVGVAESPPWQSPNPMTGEYEGFNIDLAGRIADIMGVQLEIVPATWSTLIAGLEAGQYDLVGANLFATAPRALVVSFTRPYSTYGFHIVVNADSPIQSMDDLNDPSVTFVGMSGTVEETYPAEMFPEANVRAIATNDIGAWIGEVASGQADAAFLDPGTYRILVTRAPAMGQRLRLLNSEDDLVMPVGLAWAVRPTEIHFLNFLNTFIDEVVRSDEHITLRDEWFARIADQ